MKKSHASHRGSFLLLFAILCSVCVQRAHADETPVDLFTGTFFVVGNGQAAFQAMQSFSDLEVFFVSPVVGFLTTNPSVGSFSDDHGCDNAFPCTEHYSGTFSGGSVSLAAINPEIGHQWSFAGTITGGSFSGDFSNGLAFDAHNTQTFNFISTWANGWTSDGTFSAESCFGDFCGVHTAGALTMTTVTPEPGSMTLVALGILVVAVSLRRRPNLQQHRHTCA